MAICGSVEAFEELKDRWVQGLIRREAVTHVLARDMTVTHNLTAVQCLRGGIICIGRVGEGTSVHAAHFDLDIEGLVRLDDLTRLRVDHDTGNDGVWSEGRDITHDDAITRTRLDLLSIRELSLERALGDAKVDEVRLVPAQVVRPKR